MYYNIGDKIKINVDKGSTVYAWNNDVGTIVKIVKDLFGYELFEIKIDRTGDFIFVFRYEIKRIKERKS